MRSRQYCWRACRSAIVFMLAIARCRLSSSAAALSLRYAGSMPCTSRKIEGSERKFQPSPDCANTGAAASRIKKRVGCILRSRVHLVSECPQKIGTGRGWAPVFLDVFDHQLRACVVTDVGRSLGIVHCVGQVPDENAANTKRGHSLDGERSIEDAHVGVDTHDQQGTNVPFSEETVDLRGIVGDLSLIHISEPTRLGMISYAVFCLK